MNSPLNTQLTNPGQPGPRAAGLSATRLALKLYARVSPQKAGQLVNRMAFRPSRLPLPLRYEYLLDNTDSYTQLRHGANTIPVYSWGKGPVILGIHGWAGAGVQFGAWVKPLVTAGYRVVLFDAPAHGRAQGGRTDLFEIAEVAAKVADGVGHVHGILAHSMGCIAAARAIADGLPSRHLVMVAPPASLTAVMANLGKQLGLSPEVLEVHLRLMEQQFGESVWEKTDLELLSRSLTQRGVLVIDDNDTSIAPNESERVSANWQSAEVIRTSGLGHHRLLRSPLVIDSVLQALGRPVDRV